MITRQRIILFLLASLLFSGCALVGTPREKLDYPAAKKGGVVDDHHGIPVPDPYRWLEDPDSPETRAWVEAENKITHAWLDQIPARARIKTRLTELWNYEKYGIPFKRGSRYFFWRNDGLQNQNPIYWTEELEKEPKLLIDPNTLSEDGTVALSRYVVSHDGRWFAYATSSGGSDWVEWRVREVDTGRDLDDHLKWIKFSGASWDRDNKGFYYSRYKEPTAGEELQQANYFLKLYHHRVGTPQSEDRLVFECPDHKDWMPQGEVTDDGNYLVISVGMGTDRRNRIYIKKLEDETGKVIELIDAFKASFRYIDNDGPLFYFTTDLDAPRSRVVSMNLEKPAEGMATVIPQAKEVLRYTNLIHHMFLCSYMKDARSQVKLFDMNGRFLRDLALPGLGRARGFGGRRHDRETFYSYSSFNDPGTLYRYDLSTGKSKVLRRPDLVFDPADYATKQVFYKSVDGTRVPMFITHKKGIVLNGKNPTYLNGYGGFNNSKMPSFSITHLAWMEMGGVLAIPNLRGGGEYGKDWHLAGTKLVKQNTFDDFIAAAEWLIANQYTCRSKLAIQGASNGGLLVGACMTQRPDLFGACLPAVGVMDMLRFIKFTIGWAWVSDYGSPENKDEFEALYAYSPYHNIMDGIHYPPTLITTADHDDRVVPAHSFKFAARLQAAQGGDAPILIRITTRAGHGAGKPTDMRIQEVTDILGFLVRVLDMEV